MKKLLNLLMLITVISITSCTKEEIVQPQKKQIVIDFKAEFKKSNWRYASIEDWKVLDDTKIEAKSSKTTRIHTYNIINDSFILTTNYFGSINTVPFPNLRLSNDTIYYKYTNSLENVFLIKKQ